MSRRVLTRKEVRNRWKGDLGTAMLEAMDRKFTVSISSGGGYGQLHCPCDVPTKPITVPFSPGRGVASAAKRVRARIARCPERHELM